MNKSIFHVLFSLICQIAEKCYMRFNNVIMTRAIVEGRKGEEGQTPLSLWLWKELLMTEGKHGPLLCTGGIGEKNAILVF